MKTTLVSTPLAQLETELLAVFATDTAPAADMANGTQASPQVQLLTRDAALDAAVKTILASGDFKAEANETLLIHAPQGMAARRLLLVGAGKQARFTVHALRKAAGSAVRAARAKNIREATLAIPQSQGLDVTATARALGHGAAVADFDPDFYRSDRKDKSLQSLTLALPEATDANAAEAGLREGIALGESQNLTRTLVNEPGNRLTPTLLGEQAKKMCAEQGLRCQVYSSEKLHELKMGSFWSVTQGSDEPPALIVMEYTPEGAAEGPVLGLVGKGITFDSGGLSLKPADSMEKMKYDMAGAAAMIGAMRAIALLKPRIKVISVICSAENMPSGKAQKPGDVQISMIGKSIEVLNTDAEGRLVLADGLAYAKQLGATHLIDAATLTGAVMVALGGVNAGVFCNDEEAWQHFEAALGQSGEKFWRLPLDEEYREMLRSPIADIKNVGGRYGGASTAAMFLKEFVGDTPWVHLDIAGTAWMDEAKPWMSSGPSGIAMPSIVEWVRSFAR
ncbi:MULTISPECIES: leucyl aminopeptidase [Acidobacterium]|uniref:Probable cytosol aminopeptidase n=1 Tax=Acidobacterium capsulatum (strain ATCC 51196 / DSM 11244 / BCRC 80197 / JCM 7670 / NBRC 15755 / NCIMB 13165 / 161) TaxID=240015 RepID=AMPA_ACIC5|nr:MULTISPECIES: leucyl aminopeptidase [Acidobacterium]C1F4B7.1 RecName: Full=Probable cytosol aminopeptidase; AltName: Full=Leucine aminopeptidase; Short=LAP; AltName: Full=Leucyl aminopeptidase [Acidobacterium capsulatum ATCC 51196]ACO34361.1 leucyl aminopeptidase [Acidobacterium capsulatum ATCC 51196]HCT61743.1 leucyl aminopeptidase [Acidobacterium sp.]